MSINFFHVTATWVTPSGREGGTCFKWYGHSEDDLLPLVKDYILSDRRNKVAGKFDVQMRRIEYREVV
jgi:hypothetical protein